MTLNAFAISGKPMFMSSHLCAGYISITASGWPSDKAISPVGAMRSSIALLLIHHVHQLLALYEMRDVLLEQFHLARVNAVGLARDMRRDHHVVELPERVALGQRLGVGHIQARAGQPAAVQRLD